MKPKLTQKRVQGGSGWRLDARWYVESFWGAILEAFGAPRGGKWESNGGQMATNIASKIGVDLEVHFGGLSLCERSVSLL